MSKDSPSYFLPMLILILTLPTAASMLYVRITGDHTMRIRFRCITGLGNPKLAPIACKICRRGSRRRYLPIEWLRDKFLIQICQLLYGPVCGIGHGAIGVCCQLLGHGAQRR